MAKRQRPNAPVPDYEQAQGNAKAERAKELLAMNDMQAQEAMMARPKIGEEQVIKANKILKEYKAGKVNLEKKIIANEEFWKLRQWRYYDHKDNKAFNPATAELWNCIQSRYSDIMDSYPTCNFLPRQEDDKEEAMKLSSVVPVILEQNRYEDTYSDLALYALKHGGAVQAIMWDKDAHNGLGDIKISMTDILNFFWEPGITDLQESDNVFVTRLVDNEKLESIYPQCKDHLGRDNVGLSHFIYDDHVDTSKKSCVVDWYYHTYNNGKKVLQYCKYVNNIVLYATENETERPSQTVVDPETSIPITTPTGPSIAERGLYDHAMYPFVFMSLYPVEGSLCGYGLTDIGRDTQITIDKLNKAIADNAIAGATARYMSREDNGLNEADFVDLTKKIIKVSGSLNDENIRAVEHYGLDGMYINFLQQKIDELKYVTSNQDASNGVAPSGVTSASGIAALQEAAGKNARSTNRVFFRAYREVIYQVVELIRQFYDMPRMFRIAPDGMAQTFIPYSNDGLKMQQQMIAGQYMGLRKPEFDIEVSTEKESPYKKMEMNDLALQFYNAGFFNPEMSTQAAACLQMMDFKKRDDVLNMIQQNGTLQELLVMYQQMALQFANQIDPAIGEQVAQQIMTMGGATAMPQQYADLSNVGNENKGEHPFVQRARSAARESTEVE